MVHTSVQRYYIKDSETNELWCFDNRFLSGKIALS